MILDNMGDASLVKGIVVTGYETDPRNLNRVQVYIPTIHGKFNENMVGVNEETDDSDNPDVKEIDRYPWAQCSISGDLNNMPKVNSNVWIMFETNNVRLPVVVGVHTAGLTLNSATQGTGLAGGTLAEIAAQIIFGNEGGYTSVNWNDNGAISIGKIQWHANNARNLLKKIREKNVSGFDSICNGTTLVSDLDKDWSHWKNWSSGCPCGKALKSVLGTNESKTAQDEGAIEFVQGYIDKIQAKGVTNPQCIVYLADIANQGPAYAYSIAGKAAAAGVNDLDSLHNDVMSGRFGTYEWINDSNGKGRRNRTYQSIKKAEQEGKFVQNNLTGISGATGSGMLVWPCPTVSYISSKFGWRGAISGTSHKGANFHNGIDIAGAAGSQIVAANSGKVLRNQYNAGGYGNYVMIQGEGYITLYGHMRSKSGLSVGQTVQKGTYIGPMGTTGNSSGNHCHFTVIPEANYNGSLSGQSSNAIDPLTVVTKPG